MLGETPIIALAKNMLFTKLKAEILIALHWSLFNSASLESHLKGRLPQKREVEQISIDTIQKITTIDKEEITLTSDM